MDSSPSLRLFPRVVPDPEKYAPGVSRSDYGFQGNQDIYGVGIRAGYYTQAFSVWAANFFVPHEASFLHSVNMLFMIAMLVGLIFLVADPANTWAVEPFMLLNITYSIAWVGTGSPINHDHLPWEDGIKDGLVRQLSFVALDSFALWYWFVGLPQMKRTVGDLGTVVYWWSQGDLFGWVRVANEVVTVISIVFRILDLICRAVVALQGRRLRHSVNIDRLKQHGQNWLPPVKSEDYNEAKSKVANISEEQKIQHEKSDVSEGPCSLESQDAEVVIQRTDSRSHTQVTVLSSSPTLSPISSSPARTPREEQDDHEHSQSQYQPSLEELNLADEFFQSVTGVMRSWPWYHHLALWLFYTFLCVPLALEALFKRKLPIKLAVPVMQSIRRNPSTYGYHYPQILIKIIRHPLNKADKVSWRALTLVTRFHLGLHPPPPPTKWQHAALVWHGLSFGIVLAIGTELTIQWNYIKGIQEVGSVGQLVPMSLGIGGLLKVAWGAFDGDRDWCGRTCAMERRLQKWKDVGEIWKRAKEEQERQNHIKRSQTDSKTQEDAIV